MELLRPSFFRLIKAIHHNFLSRYWRYRARELYLKGKEEEASAYLRRSYIFSKNTLNSFLYKTIPHPVFVHLQENWQKLGFSSQEEAERYSLDVALFPGRRLKMDHEELDSTLSVKKILSLYPLSSFRK